MAKTSPLWMPGPTVRVVLGVLTICLALGVTVAGIAFLTLNPDEWRVPLEQTLSQSTGRKIELGRLRLSTFQGVGLRASPVSIRNQRNEIEGQARGIFIEVDLLPLLWRQVHVQRITLDRLNLRVRHDTRGRWSLADLISRPVSGEGIQFDPATSTLELTRATIRILDDNLFPARSYELTNLDLRLGGSTNAADLLPISLQGTLTDLGQSTVLALEGKIRLQPDQAPQGDMQILVSDFQPQNWQDYWRSWLQGQGQGLLGLSAGRLDLDLRWQGSANGDYQVTGRVGAKIIQWQWPQVWGAKPWITPVLVAQIDLKQSQGVWRVNPFTLTLGELAVTLKGEYGGQNLTLSAESNDFDPYLVRDRLPVQLVNPALAPWLLTSIGKGKIHFALATQGPLTKLQTTGELQFLGLALKTKSMAGQIDSLSGKLLFDQPGHVSFEKVVLGLGKSNCTVTGEVTNNQVSAQLVGPDLDLGKLSEISGAFFPQFVGNWRGVGQLNGSLSGPLENPAFTGSLVLTQAEFRDRSLPQPVTQVAGTLLFSPGMLTLQDLQGSVDGNILYLTGSVTRPGPNAIPDLTLKGETLDLTTVRALLTSPLVGRSLQSSLSVVTNLSGLAQGSLTIRGSRLEGQLQLAGASLGLSFLNEPLTGLNGTASLANGALTLSGLKGRSAGADFSFDGVVQNLAGPSALEGTLNGSLNFPDALRLLPPNLASTVSAVGVLPFGLRFTAQGGQTLVQGQGDFSGLSQGRVSTLDLSGDRLREGNFLALAGPTTLIIQSASLGLSGGDLNLAGSISRWQGASATVNLEATNEWESLAALANSLPWMSEIANFAQGQGRVDLRLTGNVKKSAWVGGVRLREVQVPVLGGVTVQGTVGQQGSALKGTNLELLWHGAPIRLNGTYSANQVSFQAEADQLDLPRLLSDYQNSPLRDWQGKGSLSVREGILGGLGVRNLKANLTLLPSQVRLDSLQASVGSGTLTGDLGIDLNTSAYTGRWQFSRVNLGLVTQGLFGWTGDGTGDLQVAFSGEGNTQRQFVSSLTGKGSLSAQGLHWFDVVARAGGLPAGGQLTAPFTFSSGMVTSTTLQVSGPGWSYSGGGQVNLSSGLTELEGTLKGLTTSRLRLRGLLTDENVIQELKVQE